MHVPVCSTLNWSPQSKKWRKDRQKATTYLPKPGDDFSRAVSFSRNQQRCILLKSWQRKNTRSLFSRLELEYEPSSKSAAYAITIPPKRPLFLWGPKKYVPVRIGCHLLFENATAKTDFFRQPVFVHVLFQKLQYLQSSQKNWGCNRCVYLSSPQALFPRSLYFAGQFFSFRGVIFGLIGSEKPAFFCLFSVTWMQFLVDTYQKIK